MPFDEPGCLVKCFFNSPETLCPALFITSQIPMNYTSLSEPLLGLYQNEGKKKTQEKTETDFQKKL